MKRAWIGLLFVVAAAGVVGAQEQRAAGEFGVASASEGKVVETGEGGSGVAEAGGAEAALPGAQPSVFYGSRDDYRWQLGVGVEFFRFQSSRINASLVGLNTTVTYYTNSWFAVEGNVITGYAPTVYQNDHVKMVGGSGGIRIGGRKAKWEPWAHGLVGGDHLQPQTAGASRNALMAQAGIGVDYRVHARLSLRVEGDWVYTGFFSQAQNNFQGVAGAVFHF